MNDKLILLVENAAEMSRSDQDSFRMIRRQGFGASDSSILLGVNPFPNGTIEKLLEQKRSVVATADEMAIGQMVNVRKGSDLEPIIMRKFEQVCGLEEGRVEKPEGMYGIIGTHLTVNFDGVLSLPPYTVPVECKYVSAYGGKHYNLAKAQGHTLASSIYDLMPLGSEVNNIYLTRRADEAGIPIYYYTQVQQQLLALDAPFGFLAALFDKDWELKVFTIMADPLVQNALVHKDAYYWERI
jgi:predicted phage-related endonuclease